MDILLDLRQDPILQAMFGEKEDPIFASNVFSVLFLCCYRLFVVGAYEPLNFLVETIRGDG